MSLGAAGCIHGPLARWGAERASQPALEDEAGAMTFASLAQKVEEHAARLEAARLPATILLEARGSTRDRLIEFLAIAASGRCAAVADPDWPANVAEGVRERVSALAGPPAAPHPEASFYIGFTSGSSGAPKGFRRHHASWVASFRLAIEVFGPAAAGKILAPGRISHSLFLFGMLLGVWSGGGVVVQDRFSAPGCLERLAQGDIDTLVAVPSQLVLLLETARRRRIGPLPGPKLILVSGARWSRELTPALQALFPSARILEFYGASETSFIAWMEADAHTPREIVGSAFPEVEIEIRRAPGETGPGLIYVRSPMLFQDYVGGAEDDTAALRDGDWISVRDLGQLDDQGRLSLVGRQSRMIVTQGKNLFPEEVEALLLERVEIACAAVLSLPDALRGQEVVAILQAPPEGRIDLPACQAFLRARLEAYKLPRRWYGCTDWPLTVSGKTDFPALAHQLAEASEGRASCLQALS